MTHGRKPRRPRYLPTGDTFTLAAHRASKASAQDIESVLQPVRDAFKALREGVATELQWQILASSVNVAMSIENHGVVRGLGEHLKSAEAALHQIWLRAITTGAWQPTAMYWQEIDAIREYIPLHQFQLEQLSRGEVIKAMDKAQAVIRSAGGTVIDVSNMPAPQQLDLIGASA